jgi:hypothetical protein
MVNAASTGPCGPGGSGPPLPLDSRSYDTTTVHPPPVKDGDDDEEDVDGAAAAVVVVVVVVASAAANALAPAAACSHPINSSPVYAFVIAGLDGTEEALITASSGGG